MSAESQRSTGAVHEREPKSPTLARRDARERYWAGRDIEDYECPDCARGIERVYEFHVHHIDRNPFNNHPSNLVGLCSRCHAWRHRTGPTLKGMDVIEWKQAFLEYIRGEA